METHLGPVARTLEKTVGGDIESGRPRTGVGLARLASEEVDHGTGGATWLTSVVCEPQRARANPSSARWCEASRWPGCCVCAMSSRVWRRLRRLGRDMVSQTLGLPSREESCLMRRFARVTLVRGIVSFEGAALLVCVGGHKTCSMCVCVCVRSRGHASGPTLPWPNSAQGDAKPKVRMTSPVRELSC